MKDAGVELITVREKNGKCDLRHLMEETYKKGIDSILLEGGPTLAASAFEEGIVCFYTGYYAPLLFGGEDASGPIGGAGVACPAGIVILIIAFIGFAIWLIKY